MPTISRFYGILIRMYFGDHAPPHFHVEYGEHRAVIAIASLDYVRGGLPPRARALVLEWAAQHRDELNLNWQRASRMATLVPIEPLP